MDLTDNPRLQRRMAEDSLQPLIPQEEDHLNLHQTMGWTLQIVNSTMVLMDMEVDPQPLEESPKRQLHPFPTFLTFSVGKPRKVLV